MHKSFIKQDTCATLEKELKSGGGGGGSNCSYIACLVDLNSLVHLINLFLKSYFINLTLCILPTFIFKYVSKTKQSTAKHLAALGHMLSGYLGA